MSLISRVPVGAIVMPRQPREARSITAHTRFRQLAFAGLGPINLPPRRVSPKGVDEVGESGFCGVREPVNCSNCHLVAIVSRPLTAPCRPPYFSAKASMAPLHGGTSPARAGSPAALRSSWQCRPVRVTPRAVASVRTFATRCDKL